MPTGVVVTVLPLKKHIKLQGSKKALAEAEQLIEQHLRDRLVLPSSSSWQYYSLFAGLLEV